MKFIGKTVIFMVLMVGVAMRAAERERIPSRLDSALIKAVKERATDTVEKLLAQGANPDTRALVPVLALAVACRPDDLRQKNIPVAVLLLEARANPNSVVCN